MLKKLLSLAISAMLVLPMAGQGPSRTERGVADFSPLAHWARLGTPQAVEPGQPAPREPEPTPPPGKLTIDVLAGEGARNDVVTGEAAAPRVMVLDAEGNPVPDAEVVFRTPMQGTSAMFNGWVRTQTVLTDRSGVAAASGYTANDQPGTFEIQVRARSGNNVGEAVISQTNAELTPRKIGKKWMVLGVALGAAAAGIIIGSVVGGDDRPASRPPAGVP